MDFNFDVDGDFIEKFAEGERVCGAFDDQLRASGTALDAFEAGAAKLSAAESRLVNDIERLTREQLAEQAAAQRGLQTWNELQGQYAAGGAGAAGASRELAALNRQMQLENALAEKDPLKQRAAMLRVYTADMEKSTGAVKANGGSWLETARDVAIVGQAVLGAIEAVGRFAESVAQVGLEFIKAGIEANDWESDIKGSFETSLDSAEETKKALIDMKQMAQNAGIKFEDAGASLKKLFGAGYNRKQSEDIFAAGADVRGKMGGGQEGTAAMQRFIDMSTKIKAMGKVSSRDLVGLTDMGVNPDQLLHTIALMKHTTDEGARKLMEKGQLSGGETMNAILDTVQRTVDKGGALGTQAEAGAVGDVDAALNRLHNNVHNALKGLDQAPFADVLNKAAGLLDENSVAGKRMAGVMQMLNGDSRKFADSLLDSGRMEKIFDRASAAIEKVSKYLQPIIDGALTQLGPALDHIGEMWDKAFGGTKGPDEKTTRALELVGELVVGLAEGMIEAALYTVELYEGLSDFKDAVFADIGGAIEWGIDKFRELVTYLEGTSLGQVAIDLIDGLWNGITGAWTGMLERFKGLVNLLPDAAKKALGIHSPSTVMADIGVNTAEGFTVGIERVEPPELAPPSLTKIEHTLKSFDAGAAMPAINAPSLGSDAPMQRALDAPRGLAGPPPAGHALDVNVASPTIPTPEIPAPEVAAPGGGGGANLGGVRIDNLNVQVTAPTGENGAPSAQAIAEDLGAQLKAYLVRELEGLGVGFGTT